MTSHCPSWQISPRWLSTDTSNVTIRRSGLLGGSGGRDHLVDVDGVAYPDRGAQVPRHPEERDRCASLMPSRDSSPVAMAKTPGPWKMRPPNCVERANSSSVCSGLKSPDRPAKATTSASVIVRPGLSHALTDLEFVEQHPGGDPSRRQYRRGAQQSAIAAWAARSTPATPRRHLRSTSAAAPSTARGRSRRVTDLLSQPVRHVGVRRPDHGLAAAGAARSDGGRGPPPRPCAGDIDYYASKHLVESEATSAAVAAEREGFDAFVIGCCYDPALTQCRELVDIPVDRPARGLDHVVQAFGHSFAVLTDDDKAVPELRDRVRLDGLEGDCAASTPSPGSSRTWCSTRRRSPGTPPSRSARSSMRREPRRWSSDAPSCRPATSWRRWDDADLASAVGDQPQCHGRQGGRDVRRPRGQWPVPDESDGHDQRTPRPRRAEAADVLACSTIMMRCRRWATAGRSRDVSVVVVGGGSVGNGDRVLCCSRRSVGHVAGAGACRVRGVRPQPGLRLAALPEPGLGARGSLAGGRLYDELAEDLPVPFEFRAEGGMIYFNTPEQGGCSRSSSKAPPDRRPRHGADRWRRGPRARRTDPHRRARGKLLQQRRPDQHADRRRRPRRRRAGRRVPTCARTSR